MTSDRAALETRITEALEIISGGIGIEAGQDEPSVEELLSLCGMLTDVVRAQVALNNGGDVSVAYHLGWLLEDPAMCEETRA